jgi:hypothetical protein
VDVAQITTSHILVASDPFFGIRSSGTYVLAGAPVGSGFDPVFVRGSVIDAGGLPIADALVLPTAAPLGTLTNSAGTYVAFSGLSKTDLPTYVTIAAQNADASLLGGGTPLLEVPAGDPSIIIIIEIDDIIVREQSGTTTRITVVTVKEVCVACPEAINSFFEQAFHFINQVVVPALMPQQVTLFQQGIEVAACEQTTVLSDALPLDTSGWTVTSFDPEEPPIVNACGDIAIDLVGIAYEVRDLVPLEWSLEDSTVARVRPSSRRIDPKRVQLEVEVTGLKEGSTLLDIALALQEISVGLFVEVQLPVVRIRIFCPGRPYQLDPEVRAKARFLEQSDVPLRVTPPTGEAGRLITTNQTPLGSVSDCRPLVTLNLEAHCAPDAQLSVEFFQIDDRPVPFVISTATPGPRFQISHAPQADLSSGAHTVAVSAGIVGTTERELYTWDFEVEECDKLVLTLTTQEDPTVSSCGTLEFPVPASSTVFLAEPGICLTSDDANRFSASLRDSQLFVGLPTLGAESETLVNLTIDDGTITLHMDGQAEVTVFPGADTGVMEWTFEFHGQRDEESISGTFSGGTCCGCPTIMRSGTFAGTLRSPSRIDGEENPCGP